ncbi:hypothetical protein A5906_39825 [Bradyrhizobium sacchari]|uniref:Uncharacterized protein n=1 Tax=Bradyrhizobium sacchari TaxID=1399419 RepID=A0A560JNY5_9BRAD|nr:hypothetical protein [Bradyrhizobium sacchari]OPY97022.1 hypothetical protein A5906_39825 [Bradyrhizobium sacchari]TWB58767.1 hypothetical protein FBZ94_10543 [Bradyrhizobium sacchari]TWB72873.1 hypothetical protein FBZ95_106588 [Bradyrhizobium sacchari]
MPFHIRSLATAIMGLVGFGAAHAADVSAPPAKAEKPVTIFPAFLVNDNRVTYSYLPNGTDPGVTAKTAKQVYSFTHFDAWAYGTNLISLSLLKSDHNDPAQPCAIGRTGCSGASEFYGFVRSTFGFNQIFNTKALTVGPLHNVSLEVGADAEVENNALSPAKRVGVVGLQFAFDLPYKGFFNVAPMYYKEINHSAFIPAPYDSNQNFDSTWTIETNYYMDLGFLPDWLPLSVSGRAAWIGPKGTGTNQPGTLTRKLELNSEPIRLTLDASKAFAGAQYTHMVDVWVAYRYWQNKFGLDHNLAPQCVGTNAGACTESSVYTGVTVKF